MNRAQFDARLAALGIELAPPAAPIANFVAGQQAGGLLYVSGQILLAGGQPMATGQVGASVTLEDARAAARQCALAILSILRTQLGSSLAVHATLQLQGFVNAAPGFTQHPAVINGASDLMVDVLGDVGRHSRLAVGVSSLPLDVPVEVAAVFQVG